MPDSGIGILNDWKDGAGRRGCGPRSGNFILPEEAAEGHPCRFRATLKDQYGNAPLDTPIPAVQRAQDIIIAVIGGAGKHSAYIPTFGATKLR